MIWLSSNLFLLSTVVLLESSFLVLLSTRGGILVLGLPFTEGTVILVLCTLGCNTDTEGFLHVAMWDLAAGTSEPGDNLAEVGTRDASFITVSEVERTECDGTTGVEVLGSFEAG